MIIKNGLVALSGETAFLRRDIRVNHEIITEIANDIEIASQPDTEIIDATDCWVLPGGIDPHVHFYDPGNTHKEDFAHGTEAAAAGGITTIVDMPCTSIPPVTDSSSLASKMLVVASKATVDFGLFAGVSRQLFDSSISGGYVAAMESVASDVLGYKVYAISGMDEVWGAVDHFRFRRILETAKRLGVVVLLHAEDAEYVNNATSSYNAKGKDPEQWYASRPELAEILAVESAVRIASTVGCDLHIVHIGSGEAAAMISSGHTSDRTGDPHAVVPRNGTRSGGWCISGETCPHYLAFGLEDFTRLGAALKVAPSIKGGENRGDLWRMLADGTLSFVASDHAPGTAEEKAPGNIWENSSGIAGIETLLPFMFSEGFLGGRLTLPQYLAAMHENAAKRYGIFDRKGSITVGKHADLILIDTRRDWTVRADRFHSKGKLSPFEGTTFRGTVMRTVVRGNTVYERGNRSGRPGWGVNLKPKERSG